DVNLVALPGAMPFATAASLGCRFATAFRAVTVHGRVAPGQWVAVHGCGGVGLSAVMVAAARGARVVAVDVSPAARDLARRFGAGMLRPDRLVTRTIGLAGTPAALTAMGEGASPGVTMIEPALTPA